MNKILLVDKPIGWTSFDVVAKIRQTLKYPDNNQELLNKLGVSDQETSGSRIKVGHAGTLDPLASGLLVVLIGKATKDQSQFMKLDKTYHVTAMLGEESSTGDEEGAKQFVSDFIPTDEQIKQTLFKFSGQISQIPPVFSAIKVNGRRSYELARKGRPVELEPRRVTIYEYSGVNYSYPSLSFTVSTSSGTYIRSLVQDIGRDLKAGAYTKELRRTAIGGYDIADAIFIN